MVHKREASGPDTQRKLRARGCSPSSWTMPSMDIKPWKLCGPHSRASCASRHWWPACRAGGHYITWWVMVCCCVSFHLRNCAACEPTC